MRRLLWGGVALLAGLQPALADNTDTGTVAVGGTIVAPLTASATALVMPNLVRPVASAAIPGGNTSVTLGCDATADSANVVTYTGRGNPFANGVASAANPSASSTNKAAVASNLSTGQCSVVSIGGQANYFYKVVIGSPTLTGAPAGVTLATGSTPCTDAVGTPVSSGDVVQIQASGSTTLRCGAKVTLSSATTVTSYSGSFPITITYD
jgi:hypothetical protein